MLTIRNLQVGAVVDGGGVAVPSLLDGREDSALAGSASTQVGAGVAGVASVAVELAGVGLVEVEVLEGDGTTPLADRIAGLVAYELEDVGTDIEATKSVEIPVGLNGGDLAEKLLVP